MSAPPGESLVSGVFARLARLLATGNDTYELLDAVVQACTTLLKVKDAGLILARDDSVLQVMASTSERSALIEAIQLSADEGPCMTCFATGETVAIAEIERLDYWPAFREMAATQGFRSVHAVPLRLRSRTIGALNLFREQSGRLGPLEVTLAGALADVATAGILQDQILGDQQKVQRQLQHALDSRVVIEQAKGVIAQRDRISVDEAFFLLRGYARRNRRRLQEVAQNVVAQHLHL